MREAPKPLPPQVFVMEDEEQRTSFRNLSIHRANNEEEALNLVRGGGGAPCLHPGTGLGSGAAPCNHALSTLQAQGRALKCGWRGMSRCSWAGS